MAQAIKATAATRRPIGFLLKPLGWAAGWLMGALKSHPELIDDVLSLSNRRMHLIALALAHSEAIGGLPDFLLRGSPGAILDRALGRRPKGLKRALGRLQDGVLAPQGYCRLIELLEEPAAAKTLAHAFAIDDDDLNAYAEIPAVLRPAVLPFMDSPHGLSGFGDGLRFLVSRGAADNVDALVEDLRSCRQPAQLRAKVRRLVERLPLPVEMPSPYADYARRLDDPAEIRDLAKRWHNCLDRVYLSEIEQGIAAVYLWEAPGAPAACLVQRHGRLGWFLDEVKGPENADIEAGKLRAIEQAFASHGIPPCVAIDAIETIMKFIPNRPCARGREPDDEGADIPF